MISGKMNSFVHFTIQYLSLFSMGANKYEWKYNIKLRCRTTCIFGGCVTIDKIFDSALCMNGTFVFVWKNIPKYCNDEVNT